MAGKTPRLALRAFSTPIQSALSCFATGKVTVAHDEDTMRGNLAFNGGRPTKLNGPEKVRITCAMKFAIVDSGDTDKPWKVHTVHYIYRLLDRHDSPIVDYHWHPEDTPEVSFPHLHARQYGCKRHYLTGRVLIEDLLVLAVECGAIPSNPEKWKRILKANRANFALGTTWGIPHPTP